MGTGMQIKKAEYRGAMVSYRTGGASSSKALVFIHGAGGDSKLFYGQMSDPGKEYGFIAPDLPAHGKSKCDYLPTLGDYAEAIECICALEKIESIIPVGLSMGGAVALELIRRGNVGIHGLVFISTGAVLPVSQLVFDLIERDYKSFCEFLVKFTFGSAISEDVRKLSLKELLETGRAIIENDFRICSRADGKDLLPRITAPALVMVNEKDKMVPKAVAAELAEGITGAVMKVYPGESHVPQIEHAKQVNDDLMEFLSGLK